MRRCAVTGSFDPITIGHMDIIKKAATLFDEVYVAVLNNEAKDYMFSLQDRAKIATATLSKYPNIKVFSYTGYVIQFCDEHDITTVVRGYRNSKDFEYETNMSRWNKLHGNIDTLLLTQDIKEHAEISSTLVRENMGRDDVIKNYLEQETIDAIKEITEDGR